MLVTMETVGIAFCVGATSVNLLYVPQVPGDWKEEGNLQLLFYLGLDTACWRRRGQKSAACEECIPLTFFTISHCVLPLSILVFSIKDNILTGLLTGVFRVSCRENVNELQQSHMKEMERALAQLQDERRKKEADYEEKLLLIRQQQTSKVRCLIFCFYCAFIRLRWVLLHIGLNEGVKGAERA